jgi:hypothetical protein
LLIVIINDPYRCTLTLIPSGHQAFVFFFHGIELSNIINDFIVVNEATILDHRHNVTDELAHMVLSSFNLSN